MNILGQMWNMPQNPISLSTLLHAAIPEGVTMFLLYQANPEDTPRAPPS